MALVISNLCGKFFFAHVIVDKMQAKFKNNVFAWVNV